MNITTCIEIDNRCFEVFDEALLLSEATLREHGVVADRIEWSMATEYNCPWATERLAAKGIPLKGLVPVADYYLDLTHFCEVEGKLEFMADERYLLVPEHLVPQARREYEAAPAEVRLWDQAAALGFQDWS